jgi:hypothetical protein
MFKYQLNKIVKFRNLFITLIWFSFFFSINLNPNEFQNFSYTEKIKIILPLVLLLIFLFYNLQRIKISINFDYLIFYTLSFSYIFFNLFNSDNSITNIFWPLYMILALIFLNCLEYDEKIYVSKLTIIIFSLAFIFYFYLGIIEMYNKQYFHFYGIMGSNSSYAEFKNPPRSSGLARIALIVFSALTLYLLNKKENINKKYFFLFAITFLGTCVLIFQSRTISFIYLTLNILIIIFYYKKFFKHKMLILFLLIFPIALNGIYFSSISFLKGDKFVGDVKVDYSISNYKNVSKVLKSSLIRHQKQGNYTSGRYHNWKKSIEIIKSNIFIGYGAQSDRIYIKQSIHNASLYSYLAGGIIGFIILIIIYLRTLFFLIKLLFQKNINSFEISFNISIIIILNLRSILETSFAVFSIDYLAYIIAYFILKDKVTKYVKDNKP